MRTDRACFIGGAAVAIGAGVAAGQIVGGTATEISPPAAVGSDNFDTNELFAFAERQNVVLTSDLTVDGGLIAAGTVVSSFYVVYDPASTTTITGTVEFADQIIGIITDTAGQNGSDFLGAPGTSYLNPSLRGLESNDSASFSGTTLSVSLSASSPGDAIRVITVPAPASASVLAALGLVGLRRRRG